MVECLNLTLPCFSGICVGLWVGQCKLWQRSQQFKCCEKGQTKCVVTSALAAIQELKDAKAGEHSTPQGPTQLLTFPKAPLSSFTTFKCRCLCQWLKADTHRGRELRHEANCIESRHNKQKDSLQVLSAIYSVYYTHYTQQYKSVGSNLIFCYEGGKPECSRFNGKASHFTR